MNTYTENKIVNLNSKNAIKNNSTFLSNVIFNTQGLITDDDDIIERYITIQNAQIPFSFYNINIYNDIIKIEINSIIYTLVITRGNYNANTLIEEIQIQLSNNLINDLKLTISETTGLITMTKITGEFTILFNGSTMYNILGFFDNIDYTSSSGILICPHPLNLLGTLRLRICSHEISTDNLDYSLLSIPIDVGNFGLIQYTNISGIKLKLNNINLDIIDIIIIDDDDNLINFNGINWTMTLLISIVKTKPINNNIKFNDVVNNMNKNDEQEEIQDDEQEETQEDIENDVNNNIDELPQDENNDFSYPQNEGIHDDLDLLLYENNGNI